MAISIPATTIRSKYLKSIPVMTVYQDPNGHKYHLLIVIGFQQF